MPLVFADEADLKRPRQDETWDIPDIRTALERGAESILVRVHETGEQFSVLARFSPREREVLPAGGLRPLNITAGEAALVVTVRRSAI